MQDEIMSLSEVAEYLKIATKTVTRMIKREEIPAIKLAGQWRFKKSSIDYWLNEKVKPIQNKRSFASLLETQDADLIPLSRILDSSMIVCDLQRGTTKEIINQLTKPLRDNHIIYDTSNLEESIINRERISPTTIGDKVAFPHIRDISDNQEGFPPIIIGVCKEGTFYNDYSSSLTYVFFLILVNNEISHLKLLSKLVKVANNDKIVSALIEERNTNEIIRIFLEDEYENMAKPKY